MLTRFWGAKRGANSDRCWATPGHVQPLSVQVNGTSGHVWHRQATVGECLLNSRSAFESRPAGRPRCNVYPRRPWSHTVGLHHGCGGEHRVRRACLDGGVPGRPRAAAAGRSELSHASRAGVPASAGHSRPRARRPRERWCPRQPQRAVPQPRAVPGRGWRPGHGHRFPPSHAANGTVRLIAPPVPS